MLMFARLPCSGAKGNGPLKYSNRCLAKLPTTTHVRSYAVTLAGVESAREGGCPALTSSAEMRIASIHTRADDRLHTCIGGKVG
jgi:hypothetical protein